MGGVGSGGKPKEYSPELVDRVGSLYAAGHTQNEIAKELSLTQKVIWRLMKNHDIPTRVAANRDQAGPANHIWKGDDAGYSALHLRVAVVRGAPSRCDRCGREDPALRYEWANLTGRYQNVDDYERMCVSCHRKFDGERRAATGERTSPVRRSA